MSRNFNPSDSGYNEVASRIVEFREKYPEGALQPVNPDQPYKVETIGSATFIVYTAAAYRGPDDTRPGIATAWEPFPGTTPYTRNSELMNAETSAWGRAIIAVLAADAKKGISTAEEVRNRQAERNPVRTDRAWLARMESAINGATPEQMDAIAAEIRAEENAGRVEVEHGEHLLHLFQQRQAAHADARQTNPAQRTPSPLASKAMLTKLHTVFNACGVKDRDEGLMVISIFTGRTVSSSKELTVAEVKALIDTLDPLAGQPDPSAALDDLLKRKFAEREMEESHDHAA